MKVQIVDKRNRFMMLNIVIVVQVELKVAVVKRENERPWGRESQMTCK